MSTEGNELSLVLISLFRGIVNRDDSEVRWQGLLSVEARVRDYVAVLGLQLVLDEEEGYAYLSQVEAEEGETELPRLVARRQLSYPVSLILALLRRKLTEHDTRSGDPRLVVEKTDLVETIRTFLPTAGNEARISDSIDSHLKKIAELGFIRFLGADNNSIEIKRILGAFVDAQWLKEFDARLAEYRGVADEE